MLGIIKIQIYQQLPFMDNIAQHIICVNCHSLKMTNKWGSPKTVSYTNLLLHNIFLSRYNVYLKINGFNDPSPNQMNKTPFYAY